MRRYEKEFEQVQDVFELQRNLNNAFAYDLVPSPSVITAALRAARRVNDYPTAVRIFEGMYTSWPEHHGEPIPLGVQPPGVSQIHANICTSGIKAKVENKGQYDEYLQELESVREELGVNLKENLYPESS